MMKQRTSRLALRIYLFGLIQFVVVAMAMELDHQLRGPPSHRNQGALEGPPRGPGPPDRAPGSPGPPGRPGPPVPPPPPPPPPPLGHPGPPHGPPWLGWPIAVVVAVVGVTSWLTARSIARPLTQLRNATRAFGEGRLQARANLRRTDEIGEVAAAFDHMADRIAALLHAERELLANVSHELRTPLARIRVALDLASEDDARMTPEDLSEIAQDLAELERIVADVLASARLGLDADGARSSLPVRAERLDPEALLAQSVAKFSSAHPERVLEVEIASPLPPISADPVLLRRVVDNLLDNAHKYTDKADAPIVLDARADGDELWIEVRDRGVGIGPEDLARLGDPFFRVDRSRTRATGGLGLGLTLARRVIDAHHGKLTFESEVGGGTTARITLPLA